MKKKRAPGNTTKQAQGRRSFIGSDTLPTDIGRHSDYDAKAVLEAAGVKFLGPVKSNNGFQHVELPQGWKKMAINHSMWLKLVDDKGRERANIFHKPAFYDRGRAYMSLSCRFGVSFNLDRLDKENIGVANVTDGSKVIHTTKPILANSKKRHDVSDKAIKIAVEWLDQNHPDWRNPGAYWD